MMMWRIPFFVGFLYKIYTPKLQAVQTHAPHSYPSNSLKIANITIFLPHKVTACCDGRGGHVMKLLLTDSCKCPSLHFITKELHGRAVQKQFCSFDFTKHLQYVFIHERHEGKCLTALKYFISVKTMTFYRRT